LEQKWWGVKNLGLPSSQLFEIYLKEVENPNKGFSLTNIYLKPPNLYQP